MTTRLTLLFFLLLLVTAARLRAQAPADKSLRADVWDAGTGSYISQLFSIAGNNGKVLGIEGGAWALVTAGAGGGGDALTTNPLSQFAATTSAQLRGVMTDESGSGALLFQNGNIGAASATSLDVPSGNVSVGATAAGVRLRVIDTPGNDSLPAMWVTRRSSGTPGSPPPTAVFSNDGDAIGGSDYQNEVHVKLQAGTTTDHGRFIDFVGYDGNHDWTTGVTGTNRYSIIDVIDAKTRLVMHPTADVLNPGATLINSTGTGEVRINYHSGDAVGTGGLGVYAGGIGGAKVFGVSSAGAVTASSTVTAPGLSVTTGGGTEIAFTGGSTADVVAPAALSLVAGTGAALTLGSNNTPGVVTVASNGTTYLGAMGMTGLLSMTTTASDEIQFTGVNSASIASVGISLRLNGGTDVQLGSAAGANRLNVTAAGNIDIAQDLTVTGKMARSVQASTLAAAATTLAVTRSTVTLTGDAGGNTLATITGGVAGMELTLLFVDSLVTITDTAGATANSVNLSASFTSTAEDTLTLVFNGTKWLEKSRSVN